ncbi:hypothetical protein G6F65_014413 [Rhizopus arrhizus]|nr:hypothetical protein G6F65_014413 [Rhizopus arrhizus]
MGRLATGQRIAPQPQAHPGVAAVQAATTGIQATVGHLGQHPQRFDVQVQAHAQPVAARLHQRPGLLLECDPLALAQPEATFLGFDPGTATHLHPDREAASRRLQAAQPGDAQAGRRAFIEGLVERDGLAAIGQRELTHGGTTDLPSTGLRFAQSGGSASGKSAEIATNSRRERHEKITKKNSS